MAYINGNEVLFSPQITIVREGYAAGQQAEYDRFWDTFQNKGKRVNYKYAFWNTFWNNTTYNPKYPIVCSEEGATPASCMFDTARITDTKVPIEIIGCVADSAFVRCTQLVTIQSLKLVNVSRYTSAFTGCSKLKNITIAEGSSIDVDFNISATAVLTNTSVQSIIDHLKDLTGATTQKLTFHATVGGKLTDAQKATITAKNWTLVY
jgi:hypothetical protein